MIDLVIETYCFVTMPYHSIQLQPKSFKLDSNCFALQNPAKEMMRKENSAESITLTPYQYTNANGAVTLARLIVEHHLFHSAYANR